MVLPGASPITTPPRGDRKTAGLMPSSIVSLNSFRPETVFLIRPCGLTLRAAFAVQFAGRIVRPGGVNLRAGLCGVPMYASEQSLDFLARTKKSSFPNWKLIVSHPEFPDGN